MLLAHICGMAMHMVTSVIQNTGMVAGLGAATVTGNGREEACHTIYLVILLPRETLTTKCCLHQVLCNLPDILADAAHAWTLVQLSIAQTRIGSRTVMRLQFTVEILVHDALEPVLEISTTLMLGTPKATNPRPLNATSTTTSNQKSLLLAVAARQPMKTHLMRRPALQDSVHRSYHRLLRYLRHTLHVSLHHPSPTGNNLSPALHPHLP